ncbi:Ribonuclease [Hexamita inflata]|uniref:Ribonuclease n=1 Tax=Hexamita inflata TaxID=28002 RepID=A0AA86UN55_9EUKA|nr:Ribonuclease [Hexamita inflata]
MLSVPSLSESNAESCVICQSQMPLSQIQADQSRQAVSNLPLVQQLQFSNDPLVIITLPCTHQFHRACLVKWIHFDNSTCPLCRTPINLPGLDAITWKLNNIAVRTRCSPESIRLGLKAEGWFNVQLQIVPPNGRVINRVRYVFHPAFSLNKLDILAAPYDLVMKLVSNSVEVVIEVLLEDGKHFTFTHQLSKDMCSRTYYEDMYNGLDESREINALEHFSTILTNYKRDEDYYVKEMPPPPRFQQREREQRGFFGKLFGGLFQG